MKKVVFLLSVIVIIILIAIFFVSMRIYSLLQVEHSPVWTADDQLEYANKLFAKGLNKEAVEELEKYIEQAELDRKELARFYYRLGEEYMDLYRYEDALKSFYRAEMLDKDAEYKEEMNEKIVSLLENLGMSSQAQYELSQRVGLGEKKTEGDIVARVGEKKITQSEIDKAIADLPPWIQERFTSAKNRLEFIRQYVSSIVLYEKAKRLGIDKAPEFRRKVEDFKRQLAVREIIQREIKDRLKMDEDSLKLYYQANKDKYKEPEKIKLSYVELSSDMSVSDAQQRLKEGEGEDIPGWVEKGSIYLPQIGEAKDAIEELFLKSKGEISQVFKIKDKSYIFLVKDKIPERIKDFSEVKEEIGYEYRMSKENEIVNSLLNKALEEQEVEIYYSVDDEQEEKKDTR
jgi:peptidyl-prolyl cis-trans isomerase C